MTKKRKTKRLLFYGLGGMAAFVAAMQIYVMRELFFVWLMFFVLFCLMTASLFLLLMFYETGRAVLNWIVPRILAVLLPNGARFVRSH